MKSGTEKKIKIKLSIFPCPYSKDVASWEASARWDGTRQKTELGIQKHKNQERT